MNAPLSASGQTTVGITPPGTARRSVSIQFLQIAGTAAIVGFHVNAPAAQAGWAAVEWFFVIAGMNMASAWVRQPTMGTYVWSRVRRLLPELAAIWLIAMALVLTGKGTAGMTGFITSAPVFLQNLTIPFFTLESRDAVFAPLWFVGALVQLQLLVYATRRFWEKVDPWKVIAAVFVLGFLSRLCFVIPFSHHWRTILSTYAEALYFMPFCHIEAFMLGVMLGRGALPAIGRGTLLFLLAMVAAGAANGWLASGGICRGCFGYEYPLHRNLSYLWGYPILALAAASTCAKNGPLTVAISRAKLPVFLERAVAGTAPLTYGIYCFHGLLIATGINGTAQLSTLPDVPGRLLLFLTTFIEAALVSALFVWGRKRWGSGHLISKPLL